MSNGGVGVIPDIFRQIRNDMGPGMEREVIEKILRGYFSGKRDSLRTHKLLDVLCEGKKGAFKGMAVDISRSGILLRIMDPAFASAAEVNHLMPYTARVWFHFEGGFWVHFKNGKLKVNADVVRVTGFCGRGQSLILIGCKFRRHLTPEECEELSIPCEEDRPPGLD